jgi:hypothetical protein
MSLSVRKRNQGELTRISHGKLVSYISHLEKLQYHESRGKEESSADCGDEVDFFGEVVASFIVGSSHDVLH